MTTSTSDDPATTPRYHPKKDLGRPSGAFNNFAHPVKEAFPDSAAGKVVGISVHDEARFGQQGTLEYIGAPKSSLARGSRITIMIPSTCSDRCVHIARLSSTNGQQRSRE
jgi:hypothetical protein